MGVGTEDPAAGSQGEECLTWAEREAEIRARNAAALTAWRARVKLRRPGQPLCPWCSKDLLTPAERRQASRRALAARGEALRFLRDAKVTRWRPDHRVPAHLWPAPSLRLVRGFAAPSLPSATPSPARPT